MGLNGLEDIRQLAKVKKNRNFSRSKNKNKNQKLKAAHLGCMKGTRESIMTTSTFSIRVSLIPL